VLFSILHCSTHILPTTSPTRFFKFHTSSLFHWLPSAKPISHPIFARIYKNSFCSADLHGFFQIHNLCLDCATISNGQASFSPTVSSRHSGSTMLTASPAYLLGGVSLLSTVIVTIVNGVCYGFSRASMPHTSLTDAVTVSFSIISCSVIIFLILILANELKTNSRTPRKGWKATTYITGIGYLVIATGITAGTIAWSTMQSVVETKQSDTSIPRQPLLVARCALWAISVLTQGMLCGVLLITMTKHDNRHNQWPTLVSYELNTLTPSRPGSIRKEISHAASSMVESQRPSVDTTPHNPSSPSRATSRGSTRYSGRTLAQSDSKRNSLDLNPALVSYPESATTCTRGDRSQEDQGRSPHLQRHSSQIKRSLDSVMLRPSSTISSSTAQSDATTRPPKLKLPDESNIHPLFRSSTRSPPPTTTPTTMVLASPEAGQTITVKALHRMRSTRSVGPPPTPRGRSPLFEQTDHLFEDIEQRPASILGCSNSRLGT
jgi:hypothetical protein